MASLLLIDTAKRGSMVRQVCGTGTSFRESSVRWTPRRHSTEAAPSAFSFVRVSRW
jgi:hypothetical protein